MKNIYSIILMVLFAAPLVAQDTTQTAEEMKQQKVNANTAVIAGVPDEFSTPLKCFEGFWKKFSMFNTAALSFLSPDAIKDVFGTDVLSPDLLQQIKDKAQERDVKDLILDEFRFSADSERPRIVYTQRYSVLVGTVRGSARTRVTLIFTRTPQGWKIGEITDYSL